MGIAVEPILGSLVFLVLTLGMFVRAVRVPETAMGSWCVGGVFAIGFLGFVAYGIGLMTIPVRALLSTREPIFIVDGYIRTRLRDDSSNDDSPGYIAVLTSDQTVACEWAARANGKPYGAGQRAAHIEFSEYGGIHKIDGQNTGVLPERMTALGIGFSRPGAP